jgi:hypothetical protein
MLTPGPVGAHTSGLTSQTGVGRGCFGYLAVNVQIIAGERIAFSSNLALALGEDVAGGPVQFHFFRHEFTYTAAAAE